MLDALGLSVLGVGDNLLDMVGCTLLPDCRQIDRGSLQTTAPSTMMHAGREGC